MNDIHNNADELIAKAEEYKKLAADAEKIDITIATMYAKRCKKPIDDLKALVDELNGQSKAASAMSSVNAGEVVSGKPIVSAKQKETVSTDIMSSSPAIPYVEQKTIKTGNLMQLDFVPAFWTK